MRPASLGHHMLLDLEGCEVGKIDDLAYVQAAMHEAAIASGATIVNEIFHRFSPQGISGVVVIAESHLAIHTWPEFGAVAVDLFTCGTTIRAERAAEWLAMAFGAGESRLRSLERSEGRSSKTQASLGSGLADQSEFLKLTLEEKSELGRG